MIDLVLLITLASPPSEGRPACGADDHGCRAEHFARLAAESKSPAGRVRRLFAAHREYLDLHARTGEARALCEARRLLDEARALKATPDYLAEAFEKTEAETREREAGLSGRCKRAGRQVAGKLEVARVEAAEPPPLLARPAEPDRVAQVEPTEAKVESEPARDEPDPLLPVPGQRSLRTAPMPMRDPAMQRLPRDPRWRARVGGGVGLLAVGGGLFAGMAVALAERTEVTRSFRALDAAIEAEQRDATGAERAQVARLDRQYGLLTFAAGATGVAATVAVISGVSLIVIPTRRARTLALPWTGPRAAGILLRGHF